MPYTPDIFTDNVTVVHDTHLNKMGAGIQTAQATAEAGQTAATAAQAAADAAQATADAALIVVPAPVLPNDIGKRLTVNPDGTIGWGSSTGAAGRWDPSPAPAGGRGQVVVYSLDGTVAVSGSDQGGSNRCTDFTGLHEWDSTNAECVTVADHQVNGIFQSRHDPLVWYKQTGSSGAHFCISTDGAKTWTIDTSSGAPVRGQNYPGGSTGDNPRAVDPKGWTTLAGDILVATDTGVARKTVAAGVWEANPNLPAMPDGGTPKCICIAGDPIANVLVWVVFATNVGGVFRTWLYKCGDFRVAGAPTWTGPYTGGTTFTTPGATFYPQHVVTDGVCVLATCVNPYNVSANESVEHGLYVLDAKTSGTSTAWHKVTALTVPARTGGATPSGPTLVGVDMKVYGDGTTGVAVSFDNCSSSSPPVSRTFVTGQFLSTNMGTWVDLSPTQPNQINGQAGEPWCFIDPGTVNFGFSNTGVPSIALHPTNKDFLLMGGPQGYYRVPDLTSGAPHIYPIPFGAGGATEFPGAAIDSLGCLYIGLSDQGMAPAPPLAGPSDPGKCLRTSKPVSTPQFSDSIVAVDSDRNIVVFTRNPVGTTPNKAAGTGVFVRPGLDISNPLAITWPGSWVGQQFNPPTDVPGGGAGTAAADPFLAGNVVKNGSGQRVIISGQAAAGWLRKVGSGAVVPPTLPPTAPPLTYADLIPFGDGTGFWACYVDANLVTGSPPAEVPFTAGLYISADDGDHWHQVAPTILIKINGTYRNYAGVVRFKPGDHNTAIVFTDAAVFLVTNLFFDSGSGIGSGATVTNITESTLTKPGVADVHPDGTVYCLQRGFGTGPTLAYKTPFPTGVPTWTLIPDPTGRLSGQIPNPCKLVVGPNHELLITSNGLSSVVYQPNVI